MPVAAARRAGDGVGLGALGRATCRWWSWAGVVVVDYEGVAADGKFIAGQERGFAFHAQAVDECAGLRAQVPDHQALVAVVDHALVNGQRPSRSKHMFGRPVQGRR